MVITTKADLRDVFGGSYADVARVIGVTRQCINQWSDPLTQRQSDWATGAAVRSGALVVKRADTLTSGQVTANERAT